MESARHDDRARREVVDVLYSRLVATSAVAGRRGRSPAVCHGGLDAAERAGGTIRGKEEREGRDGDRRWTLCKRHSTVGGEGTGACLTNTPLF